MPGGSGPLPVFGAPMPSAADPPSGSWPLFGGSTPDCGGDAVAGVSVGATSVAGMPVGVAVETCDPPAPGADVFVAVALGARAVLLGRPYAWGLGLAGEQGVRQVIGDVVGEFDLTLGLSGYTSVGQLSPETLRRV